MGVYRQDNGVAWTELAAKPLDYVSEHVGCVHFHRRWQIEHQWGILAGLDDVGHRFGNLQGKLGFGPREAFGRVLVAQFGPVHCVLQLLAEPGRAGRYLDYAFTALAENDTALQFGGRVVEMYDRFGRPGDGLECPLDQFLTALDEHLHRHVLRYQVFFDDVTDKLVVRRRRRRKTDFDFLDPDPDEGLEKRQLAGGVHRVDERLVAIAKVDAAPTGSSIELPRRPGPVGENERQGGVVLLERHSCGGRRLAGHLGLSVAGEQKTSWPSGAGGLGEHRFGAHLGEKEEASVGAHCLSMFTQPSGYCQVVPRTVPVP